MFLLKAWEAFYNWVCLKTVCYYKIQTNYVVDISNKNKQFFFNHNPIIYTIEKKIKAYKFISTTLINTKTYLNILKCKYKDIKYSKHLYFNNVYVSKLLLYQIKL